MIESTAPTEDSGTLDDAEVHRFYQNQPNRHLANASRTATAAGLETYQGEWGKQEVLHLLKRALFGVSPTNVTDFQALGLSASVDRLMKVDETPLPPINNYSETTEDDPFVPFGETWVTAPYGSTQINSRRYHSFRGWLAKNIVHQPTTVHEKMIVFLHNLLPVEMVGSVNARAIYQYFMLLRKHALGNYKTLIRELTTEPAMLYYLNGVKNRAGAPDENYGRELQELFTVGKGSGSGYTETDVQEAARVLTGFTVRYKDREEPGVFSSTYNDRHHDTGDKQFSAFYGNKVIVGRSGAAGAEELDELLDMIFATEEVSKYICRRLYTFFVYSEVDELAEANVIAPMAKILRDHHFEMAPALSALLKSAHFFDHVNRGAIIKSPLDHFLGFWRATNTAEVDPADISLTYQQYRGAYNRYFIPVGMALGHPPSVAGWPPYYQAPAYDKIWITTDSILTRADAISRLLSGKWWVAPSTYMKVDVLAFAASMPNASEPNDLIKDFWGLFMGIPINDEALAHLKGVLLSDQAQDYYWTNAWHDYLSDKTNTSYSQIVESRLQLMLNALAQLGEFQLM